MPFKALRAVTTLYPLNYPRVKVLQSLPEVPTGFGAFRIKSGLTLASYPCSGDYIISSLFWLGDFEPWITRTLCAVLRPGDRAVDIGANIGAMSMRMAQVVGPTGRVYAFEPIPETAERLRANLRCNALDQVTLVEGALSDADVELRMIVPDRQKGHAQVIDRASGDDTKDVVVRAQPFDRWREEAGIASVAACKIDVEGHEDHVFRGMARSLELHAVECIIFERHERNRSADDPVMRLLRDCGYGVWRIEKGFRRIHYLALDAARRAAPTADYIAVLPGSHAARELGL